MKIINLIVSLTFIIFFVMMVMPIQIISNLFNLRSKYIVPKKFFKLINNFIGIKIEVDETSFKYLNEKNNTGKLFISNHVSWIDILVIGSLFKGRFIAKKEVKVMGIFGFLANINNTFFIDNTKASRSLNYTKIIRGELLKGHNIVLFPEGTTSDGSNVHQFKSPFFESVNATYTCPKSNFENYISVQPITLIYLKKNGLPMGAITRREIAWIGDIPILELMLHFLMSGTISVSVKIDKVVTIKEFGNRKLLCTYCEDTIRKNITDRIYY